jgi:hypothetical protein
MSIVSFSEQDLKVLLMDVSSVYFPTNLYSSAQCNSHWQCCNFVDPDFAEQVQPHSKMKLIGLVSLCVPVGTMAADPASTPVLKVALAPPARPLPSVSTFLSAASAQERRLDSEGLSKVDASYKSALAAATSQIQQAIADHFARSFLQSKGVSNAVRVQVSTSPGVAHRNLAKLRNIYATLDGIEARQMRFQAHEFDSITKVVVNTLKDALRGESFLQTIPGQPEGLGDLNVRVGVPKVPFPTVEALMQASVSGSVDVSATAAGKILDRERSFVRALNGVIRATLQKYA